MQKVIDNKEKEKVSKIMHHLLMICNMREEKQNKFLSFGEDNLK